MSRRLTDRVFTAAAGFCALLASAVLVAIVSTIAVKGIGVVSWGFLTESTRSAGGAGGVFYHVLGTFILVATAAAVALPVASGLAILLGGYGEGRAWSRPLLLAVYALNGVPSILFGLFGLIVFVNRFGLGKSWLVGGILLGLMIVPTAAVAFLERIRAVPKTSVEAAVALGLTRSRVVWAVLIPQSWTGLLSGLLIGLSRAAGETAPIMFTAAVFAGATLPRGIRESPVLALPYHVFVLAQDSLDPRAQQNVWGSATVLVAMVAGLSIMTLPLRRTAREASHDA